MNGSTENRAHNAPEKPGPRAKPFNLKTARSMLPLVQRIVDDLVQKHRSLAELVPLEEQLRRRRRELSWPERARRYQIQEQISTARNHFDLALEELVNLGLQLFDSETGRVGFPTTVNGRRAYFSWRPGESGIDYWHFPDEVLRRPIPLGWNTSAELSLSAMN